MLIFYENPDFQDFATDPPSGSIDSNLWMEEYLSQSNNRLDSISEQFRRGENIGADSRDWMLNQVDFIVESLGNDSGDVDDSLRSHLLQLILAIANLNEQIRGKIACFAGES